MNFDLNIDNYRKEELEELFNLPKMYDSDLLNSNEVKLKKNILADISIQNETKQKTLKFLSEAKQIIINSLAKNANVANIISDFYNSSYELKQVAVVNDNVNFVQERERKPYLSSYPSEFFPGVINPLKKKVNRQTLNIDTRFRENYYTTLSTNFHFDLPIKISNILTMQLNAFESPITFYNISKLLGNNYFTIIIESTAEKKVVIIPDGNYNVQNMISFLNTEMATLGGDFAKISFSVYMSGNSAEQMIVESIDSVFFTLQFENNSSGEVDTITPLPLKFGWTMGFRKNVYLHGTYYKSEGFIDLKGPRYVFLVIDDYNNNVNNNFYSAFTKSVLNQNILARISFQSSLDSVSQNNLSIITYPRQYFGPVDIQKMNIQLLDEYGRVVDLNSMDYSFCLTFQTAYDV